MIKLMLLLNHKPGMSFAAFRDYYENRHVPLACSFPAPLVRYRRNYVLERTVGEPDCDCITEVWYDLDGKWSDHRDRIVTADMAAIIARDEAEFLDRSAMRIVIVEESDSAPETLPGHRPAGPNEKDRGSG